MERAVIRFFQSIGPTVVCGALIVSSLSLKAQAPTPVPNSPEFYLNGAATWQAEAQKAQAAGDTTKSVEALNNAKIYTQYAQLAERSTTQPLASGSLPATKGSLGPSVSPHTTPVVPVPQCHKVMQFTSAISKMLKPGSPAVPQPEENLSSGGEAYDVEFDHLFNMEIAIEYETKCVTGITLLMFPSFADTDIPYIQDVASAATRLLDPSISPGAIDTAMSQIGLKPFTKGQGNKSTTSGRLQFQRNEGGERLAGSIVFFIQPPEAAAD